MTREIKVHPLVRQFALSLSPDDQAELESLFASIAEEPELGERVQSIFYREARGRTVYRRKTYRVDKTRFPKGLRVVYAVGREEVFVLVMDIGDHQDSVRHPGASVYPDER